MHNASRPSAIQKSWIFVIVFIILIASSEFLLFYKLDVHYMHYFDEHFYGLNAYEMIENNDYIVHTYMGETNVNNIKPPFGLWIIVLSYKIFGFSLFSMRAQSVFSMLVSQIILGLWARKRYGNWAGLIAMAMLISTQVVYGFHFARFGDLDALYQLFFMLAMLCMIDSKRDFRRLYLSAAFCGLAFLTKSWHAFAIAFTCFAYLLVSGRLRELSVKRILLLIASFLIVVLPWAIARVVRDGFTLFEQSLSVRVAGTITVANDTEYSNPNIFGYFVYLLKQAHFSGALIISAFSALVLMYKRRRSALPEPMDKSAVWGCVAWMLATPLLLSFIEKKLDWYVFSSLYASALLTGIMVQALFRNNANRWLRVAAVSAVAVLFFLGTISSFLAIDKIENNESYRGVMEEVLDREYDSGLHVYVQYSEQRDGEFVTEWTPTDYLYAKLNGDVECLPGGVEAFLADDDYALVLLGRPEQAATIEDLYIQSNCVLDDYYVCVFSN